MKKTTTIAAVLLLNAFICFPADGNRLKTPELVKKFTVKIIGEIPHHINSFTQGLLYYDDMLYESTGLRGKSTVQKINVRTGAVIKILRIPEVFAEGLARWDNRLIQLTWKDRIAFVYDISNFSKIDVFRYETQGWGLTSDNHHLIMSDGSDKLYFRNPDSFAVEKVINVRFYEKPLDLINELEYANQFIYANVWHEKFLVQIDPEDGTVVGQIDCLPLFQQLPPLGFESVLNGIAYNETTKTFYLTGKNWPKIFEVVLIP
ncbi:MAG: glutaminyl-peptide cyclotransferase [Desulfobacterales bacterium]